MQGAASPYTWSGLSPYDMYQQAAQALQPPAVLPPMPAQPHISHMPSVMNPRLQAPWMNPDLRVSAADAYLHKLQGINGCPPKPLIETSPSATESALTSLPAFYTKNNSDLYFDTNSSVYKHQSLQNSVSADLKRRGTFSGASLGVSHTVERDVPSLGFSQTMKRDKQSFGVSHSVMRDVPSFFPSMPPCSHEAAININSHLNDTSHLKWKNAYLTPPSSSCSTSLCVSSHLSTSTEYMPVTTTAASHSVIPYKPRDYDTYSIPNGAFNEAASKEAARILEEASLSNKKSGYTFDDRKPNSLFTNISNEQRQQSSTSASEHLGLHRPSSSHSLHNTHFETPSDFSTENQVHAAGLNHFPTGQIPGHFVGLLPGKPAGLIQGQSTGPIQGQSAVPIQGDFWSEFGIPPPNVALDQNSQTSANNTLKRSGSFLSHSDGLIKVNKRTKHDEAAQETTADTYASEEFGKEKSDERKKPDKLTRRKSFTEDPVIDALVDAKVQEIMAACKEKEQQKVEGEKPKPLKSPKHSNQTSSALYGNQQTGASGLVEQHSSNPSFQNDSDNTMKGSVYDFNESDQHMNVQKKCSYPQKDLPQQVMDMRLYKKQKHSSAENYSYHMSEQKPASLPHMSEQKPAIHPHMSEQKPTSLPHMSEQKPATHPHMSEQKPTTHPHMSEQEPASHPHMSEQEPASHPHMSEQEPASHPHMSLYQKISAVGAKTKFPQTHSVEANSHLGSHVMSLNEQINEIRHSKKTAAVFEREQNIRVESFKSDASNQKGEQMVYRQVHEKEDKNQSENVRARCCMDCNKSGKHFSENCQNYQQKFQVSGRMEEDPFQFSDKSSSVGPYSKVLDNTQGKSNFDYDNYDHIYKTRNNEFLKNEHEKLVSSYEKMHAEHEMYTDIKHNVQYISENKKGQNMQSYDKCNGFHKRGFKKEKTSQKLKTVSSKLERPQGQVSATKKFGSKPFTLKSSLALLKKSQKFHHVKLPSIRKKWRNNPKYKKVTKDDFAEKLMKNLGFPPLTLKDLMAKGHCKLPKGYINGHSTIAASMLSAEDKAASRGTVPVADNASTPVETSTDGNAQATIADVKQAEMRAVYRSAESHVFRSSSAKQKAFKRSRSADEQSPKDNCKPVHRSRSWSFDDLRKESAVKVSVDNGTGVPLDQEKMKTLSDQISDLHAKVSGHQSNLESNTVIEIPKCECLGVDGIYSEAVEGPYYTHLGSGRSVEAIRKTLEQRTGQTGKAIRIEKVRYTGKEGKSKQGCPIAKWIVRRSSIEEKYMVLVRHRVNHTCDTAWLIIGLVAWEGVPATQADDLYDFLSTTLPPFGNETERRCGTNERKTCACQGADLMKRGASFSFGCSWSMYFNGCKFARSAHVRKFRLKNEDKESVLESKLQDLATQVGPLYDKCAPAAHANQCYYSEKAQDCRLGDKAGGPFSGVTACVDFCAHAHKDIHNMNNGSTVVVTLTKHRGLSKPDDEQLHVLPLYVLEPTDESGSYEGQYEKIRTGSLEVLHQFPLEARMRAHPLESCKKRRMNKKGRGGHRQAFNGRLSPCDSASSTQSTPKKEYLYSQDSNQSAPSVNGSNNNTPVKQHAIKLDINSDKPISYDDLMAVSTQAGFNQLYDKFWDYFYAFGVFPPPSILAASLQGSPSVWDKSKNTVNQELDDNMSQQDNIGHVNALPSGADCSVPSHTVKSQDHSNVTSYHGSSIQVENPFSDAPSQHYNRHPPAYKDVINQKLGQDKQQKEVYSGRQTLNKYEIKDKALESGVTALGGIYTQQPAVDTSRGHGYEQRTTIPTPFQQTKGENLPAGHFSSYYQIESEVLDLSFSSGSSKPDIPAANGNQTTVGPPSTLKRNQLGLANSESLPQYNLNELDYSKEKYESSDVSYQSPLDLLSKAADIRSKHVGYSGAVRFVNNSSMTLKGSDTTFEKTSSVGKDLKFQNNVTSQYIQQNNHHYEQNESSLPELNKHNTSYNLPTSDYSKQAHHSGTSMPNKTQELSRSSQSVKDINSFPSQMQSLKGPDGFSSQKQYEQVGMISGTQYWKPYDPHKLTCHEKLDTVNNSHLSKSEEPSLIDPDVVKCEIEYNEEAFLDPNIGGVAVALCHGAVLFEVAKRELHATTGLKNPNRYHPTRISLVFYQHKNLNNERHGMYAYEKKLEDLKMKRIEKMQLERGYVDMQEIENSFKGGKKRKMTDEEEEVAKLLQSAKGEYKYMWNCNTKRSDSITTETVSTKWIDPSPMVTGPYQKWV